MKRTLVATMVVSAAAPLAWAQVKAGPTFLVNTYTTGVQSAQAVAVGRGGEFVVAWPSLHQVQYGTTDLFARAFASDGMGRGDEFLVNTYTSGFQGSASAAVDRRGRFTVAWSAYGQYTVPPDIRARQIAPSGRALGEEFIVSTSTAGYQYTRARSLAVAPAGTFVVAWDRFSTQPDPNAGGDVFAQLFDRNGLRRGGEFRVNSSTTGDQYGPAAASDAQGAFVVVWSSYTYGDRFEAVMGQRFDSSGLPLGGEFTIAAVTSTIMRAPSVDRAPDGRFVVVWSVGPLDGPVFLQGRRFGADGAPDGAEFRVRNAATTSDELYPQVAMEESGAFVVAWMDRLPEFRYEVWARRFDGDGVGRRVEFAVDDSQTGPQYLPRVGSDAVGNFVIVWPRKDAAGNDDAVAQRFGGLQPVALAVDTVAGTHSNGNGILEPNENIDFRTTWRNVNGTAQTFAGTLAVERPGQPSPAPRPFPYFVDDGDGDYGTVANGASRECGDCYAVRTFTEPEPPAPSPSPWIRPPGHVDGTVWETITPDAQGQHKKWLLHLGATFTDVLTSNPFYRFVENLVHNGVTAGCSATTYCPGQSVTREQMAVFVLTAEDRDAAPPVCGTPRFGDVPASSAFCRWIEELARRGVTAGCTPTEYCPATAVTREHMAVFVLRTFDPNLNPPACTTPVFSDVPASSPFCRWVEELVRRGITTGCGGGRYCPAVPVSREQMAVFLTVTFGLRLYGP